MTLHSTLSIFATYWHAPHKKNLVPVFQKVDSAIHQINLYSVDWVQLVSLILVRWIEISPLDSVFSNILPNWISSCLLKCYLWQPFTILQCSRFCISLQQFSWASKVWIINKDEYNSNDLSHYRPKLFSFFYFSFISDLKVLCRLSFSWLSGYLSRYIPQDQWSEIFISHDMCHVDAINVAQKALHFHPPFYNDIRHF